MDGDGRRTPSAPDPDVRLSLPASAEKALSTIERAGHEAWVVGGFVRDALLGAPGHDVDITTDATWQEVAAAFTAEGHRAFPTGVAHGTVSVEVDGDVFEVTTYRTDGAYSDGRHPDSVAFVSDVREDLARRDFTVNAMAYHPRRGLLDPFGGRQDLSARLVRAVGDPKRRFSEDGLRVLRAVRFASQLGFRVEERTRAGMESELGRLASVSAERKAHEMDGFLCGKDAARVLVECADVVGAVVPEVAPMRGFDQRTPYHDHDVLGHTALVVGGVPPVPVLRWAALLHDAGKPATFCLDAQGVGHFPGHPAESARLAERALRRLKEPKRLVHDVVLLVRYHDAPVADTDEAVKRMVRRLDERPDLFFELCQLKRADAEAHAPGHREGVERAQRLEGRMRRVLDEGQPFRVRDMAIDGADVMEAGVPKGPAVGRALDAVLDALIGGKVPNDRDALIAFVRGQELRR